MNPDVNIEFDNLPLMTYPVNGVISNAEKSSKTAIRRGHA